MLNNNNGSDLNQKQSMLDKINELQASQKVLESQLTNKGAPLKMYNSKKLLSEISEAGSPTLRQKRLR